MVEVIKYNDDNLRDDEIDEAVIRVKCFILSSKNNMLICSGDEGYELLGGYVDNDENYTDALKRNLFSQTGIVLDSKDSIEPFYEVRYYNKDYKGSGKNRLSDLVYYLVKTDKLPNFKKLKLKPEELAQKMPIDVVKKSLFAKTLKTYIEETPNPLYQIKTKEILLAFDKLKEIYKW